MACNSDFIEFVYSQIAGSDEVHSLQNVWRLCDLRKWEACYERFENDSKK